MDQKAIELFIVIISVLLFSIFTLHYRFLGPIIRQRLRLEERLQKESNEKL